jgi:hypothetical protein
MSVMQAAKVVPGACVPRTVSDVVGFAQPVFTTDNGLRTTDCEARILASAASSASWACSFAHHIRPFDRLPLKTAVNARILWRLDCSVMKCVGLSVRRRRDHIGGAGSRRKKRAHLGAF